MKIVCCLGTHVVAALPTHYSLDHTELNNTEQSTALSGLLCIYVTPLYTANYSLDHTELYNTEQLTALSGLPIIEERWSRNRFD